MNSLNHVQGDYISKASYYILSESKYYPYQLKRATKVVK